MIKQILGYYIKLTLSITKRKKQYAFFWCVRFNIK
jgi:hypothetical protein